MITGRKPAVSRTGFTLVEILVAVAVFSLLIIPIITMFNSTARTGARTKEQMVAANLAQEKIEEYRCRGFNDMHEVLLGYLKTPQRYYTRLDEPVKGYVRHIIIHFFPDAVPAITDPMGDKRIMIKVEVKWKAHNSELERSYKLFTILADRKPYHLSAPGL